MRGRLHSTRIYVRLQIDKWDDDVVWSPLYDYQADAAMPYAVVNLLLPFKVARIIAQSGDAIIMINDCK